LDKRTITAEYLEIKRNNVSAKKKLSNQNSIYRGNELDISALRNQWSLVFNFFDANRKKVYLGIDEYLDALQKQYPPIIGDGAPINNDDRSLAGYSNYLKDIHRTELYRQAGETFAAI